MADWNLADAFEAVADALPDRARPRPGITTGHVERARRARLTARRGAHRSRAPTRLEGRAVPLQLQRVRGDVVRDVQDPRCARQRQLPLPRGRARVPPRQRGRRSRRVPRCARRARRGGARTMPDPARDRAGRRRNAHWSTARSTTKTSSPRTTRCRGSTLGRRLLVPLHRRHHRHAEGCHVAPRGPLRRARGRRVPDPR